MQASLNLLQSEIQFFNLPIILILILMLFFFQDLLNYFMQHYLLVLILLSLHSCHHNLVLKMMELFSLFEFVNFIIFQVLSLFHAFHKLHRLLFYLLICYQLPYFQSLILNLLLIDFNFFLIQILQHRLFSSLIMVKIYL